VAQRRGHPAAPAQDVHREQALVGRQGVERHDETGVRLHGDALPGPAVDRALGAEDRDVDRRRGVVDVGEHQDAGVADQGGPADEPRLGLGLLAAQPGEAAVVAPLPPGHLLDLEAGRERPVGVDDEAVAVGGGGEADRDLTRLRHRHRQREARGRHPSGPDRTVAAAVTGRRGRDADAHPGGQQARGLPQVGAHGVGPDDRHLLRPRRGGRRPWQPLTDRRTGGEQGDQGEGAQGWAPHPAGTRRRWGSVMSSSS
jgi:hypothetical protein